MEENLFEPLDPSVREAFEKGDGGELKGKGDSIPKMHAVHSSSALSVNVFQYWKGIEQVPKMAAACGFCSKSNNHPQTMTFENKCQISPKFQFSPNSDVVIENLLDSECKVFAIECKFSEAYSQRRHSGIDPKYLKLQDIWNDIPNIKNLANSLSPDDSKFVHLHPAQLIKHILALKEAVGKNGFRLLYLWYDCLGYEGATHRKEIEQFIDVTRIDY